MNRSNRWELERMDDDGGNPAASWTPDRERSRQGTDRGRQGPREERSFDDRGYGGGSSEDYGGRYENGRRGERFAEGPSQRGGDSYGSGPREFEDSESSFGARRYQGGPGSGFGERNRPSFESRREGSYGGGGYGSGSYGSGGGSSVAGSYGATGSMGGTYESRDGQASGASRSGSSSSGALRGPHAGKGPRNYRRSDERIREDVCERLADHGELDATDIEVEVSEGVATLKGQVASRRDKRCAEDCIDDVSGLRDVNNQLRLKSESHEDSRSGPLPSAKNGDHSEHASTQTSPGASSGKTAAQTAGSRSGS